MGDVMGNNVTNTRHFGNNLYLKENLIINTYSSIYLYSPCQSQLGRGP